MGACLPGDCLIGWARSPLAFTSALWAAMGIAAPRGAAPWFTVAWAAGGGPGEDARTAFLAMARQAPASLRMLMLRDVMASDAAAATYIESS